MKTKTSPTTNSINLSPLRRGFLLIALALALALFALSPIVHAVDPPPGGGYPNEVTALGEDALFSESIGGLEATALGYQALYYNTTGVQNTAVGRSALHNNTTGGGNVAVGDDALYDNTTGSSNVAVGLNAAIANTTGGDNVAVGYTAFQAHTNGFDNVAIGYGALSTGTTGDSNTAVGHIAMAFSTGTQNTAVGDSAMNQATGDFNVAIGRAAGLNLAGDNNIMIGQYAGQNVTTGANNIEIGNQGAAHDANIIRLGDSATQRKTFIAGIRGTTVSGGVAVMITNQGQLGVATSAVRYKENIQPMARSSEAILSLKPVTFRYKKELDPEAIPQFGLVAEEVEKVNPALVARDEEGKPYTVRYEAVNAMLLNEFLKEHRTVQEQNRKIQAQEATITQLEKGMKTVIARLEEQAAQIQKVSAALEARKSSPQIVLNNQQGGQQSCRSK
jgi:hypothetical protein